MKTEVEERKPEMSGHGWVNPLESGAVARCGGPGLCHECATETCRECGRIGLTCHRFEKPGGIIRTDKLHELKSWPKQFAAIRDGRAFDVRLDDGRNFSVGDTVMFKEWEYKPTEPPAYTGMATNRLIAYVYRSLLEDSPLRIAAIDHYGNPNMAHQVVVLGLAKEHE